MEHVVQELPIYGVKSFLKIKLETHSAAHGVFKSLTSSCVRRVASLISLSCRKAFLILRDQFSYHELKPVYKNFCNDLVEDIAARDRSKIIEVRSIGALRDQCDKAVVDLCEQPARVKKRVDGLAYISTYHIPVSLEKDCWVTIRPWSFFWVHMAHSTFNLFIKYISAKPTCCL